MTRTRRAGASALTVCLALSLAGCGGGRGYTVPEEACGVPLNEKALEPFLIDGEKLEVSGGSVIRTGTDTRGACWIRVDGKQVVHFQVDKVDKIYDPMAPLEEFRFTNRAAMKDLPFDGLGALGDSTAMISTACSGPQASHLIAYVSVDGKAGGDLAERRRNVEALALDFVPEVKKALGCAE
ncbi:hypothetical protein [Streptomyces sp. DH12]|uniref:hypothetical protein n=1 Tax=Streptomyces sp. DH12 TaxID=2857010 RepID=UPI001E4A80E6|nr:hypothetical protein [Streptomyces sp. DH12]